MNEIVLKVVLLLIAITLFSACRYDSNEDTAKVIAGSERFARVDRICSEMPKPEGFKFTYKSWSGNNHTVTITHQFDTKMRYEEIKKFFVERLGNEGWMFNWARDEIDMWTLGHISFSKDDVSIYIEHNSGQYSISCSQKS